MDVLEAACGIRHIGMRVSRSQRATCQLEELLLCRTRLSNSRSRTLTLSHSCFPDNRFTLTRSLHNCISLPLNGTVPYSVTSFLGQLMH
jgi:hypothetical protein